MVDPLMGAVTFTVSVVLLAMSVALLITFPFALPFIWGLAVSSRAMAAVERACAIAVETIGSELDRLDIIGQVRLVSFGLIWLSLVIYTIDSVARHRAARRLGRVGRPGHHSWPWRG